jgi:hypothetical protein
MGCDIAGVGCGAGSQGFAIEAFKDGCCDCGIMLGKERPTALINGAKERKALEVMFGLLDWAIGNGPCCILGIL